VSGMEADWEALPRRQKRQRGGGKRVEHGGINGSEASSSGLTHAEAHGEATAAAVRERAGMRRAAPLGGHDETRAMGDFEFLDHTADVQLHAWGDSLEHAMEELARAMFHYMSDIRAVTPDPACQRTLTIQGHDRHTMVFRFLDELLFLFSTEGVICSSVTVERISQVPSSEGSGSVLELCMAVEGELFDLEKHPTGTEIKAITFSNMQVLEKEEEEAAAADGGGGPTAVAAAGSSLPDGSGAGGGGAGGAAGGGPHHRRLRRQTVDLFVIVDI